MPPAKKDQKKKKRDNESSDPPRKKRKPNPKKKSKPKKVVNNLPIYSPAKAIVLILGDKIQVGTDSQDLPLTSRIFFLWNFCSQIFFMLFSWVPCVMAIRRKKPRERRQKPERTPRGKLTLFQNFICRFENLWTKCIMLDMLKIYPESIVRAILLV